MPANPVQRRLAAILAADVAGYSRLMGEDEEGTLATLTAHLKELIEPCIAEHRGRVVKTTGDGLLAEFASVVDAVRCAVAFQFIGWPIDRLAVNRGPVGVGSRCTGISGACKSHLAVAPMMTANADGHEAGGVTLPAPDVRSNDFRFRRHSGRSTEHSFGQLGGRHRPFVSKPPKSANRPKRTERG
jgi:hypothetical protein